MPPGATMTDPAGPTDRTGRAQGLGPGRRSVLAGLLVAGAGLAGCSRIPTSGPVTTQTDIGGGPVDRPFPQPPRSGSTPAQIVQGFLRAAGIGAGDDFSVARTYFADDNVAWDPDAQVVVYSSPQVVVVSGPGSSEDSPRNRTASASPTPTPTRVQPPAPEARAEVEVRLRGVLASVDPYGLLTQAPRGEEQRRRFQLVARGGEWRIDGLDDGLVVTVGQWSVPGFYQPTPLYYADPTGRWLVPDLRYLRQKSDSTPTLVVTALLHRPADWLVPAVTQPRRWPALKVSSVPVDSQVATVDLDKSTLTLEESVQAVLRLQMRDSLREATASTLVVRDVRVTVDGQPLQDLTGSPSAVDPAAGAGRPAEPRPAFEALAGTTFVGVDAKARVVVGGPQAVRPVDGLTLTGGTRPAMSYTDAGRTYALVVAGKEGGRRTLKVAEGTSAPLDVVSAADLVAPSFDSSGWVWTAARRAAGRFTAGILVAGRVRVLDVPAPWLDAGQVVALRVSREGARALVAVDAVASDGRRRTRVWLAGVVRSRVGEPVRLTSPTPLVPDLVRGSDVGWLDDRTAVVLGSRRREDRRLVVQPWLVDVGGDPTLQGVRPTADLGQIVVGADGKPLTTPDGWERLGLDVAPTLAVGDGVDSLFVAGPRGDLFQYRSTGSWERRVTVFRPAFPG